MDQDKIKEAFKKVKGDIFSLGKEVDSLREDIVDLKSELKNINEFINELKFEKRRTIEKKNTQNPGKYKFSKVKPPLEGLSTQNKGKTSIKNSKNFSRPQNSNNNSNISKSIPKDKNPTHSTQNPTIQHKNPTQTQHSTHRTPLESLKNENLIRSTRNEGVPTDRQTNRQTDTQHINNAKKTPNSTIQPLDNKNTSKENNSYINPKNIGFERKENHTGDIEDVKKARDILENLDSLKKDLRRKFKKLTKQEMKVFSLIYQLDQEGKEVDYSTLASKMNLSEGSIRDYVHKIIKKGISLEKEKKRNKRVILHISDNIKEITTLDTILKLREI
ncbi:MAG: hypothetical protein ACOC1P_06045 [Minisyncoccales bacterium]